MSSTSNCSKWLLCMGVFAACLLGTQAARGQQQCGPAPGGTECLNVTCPIPNDHCVPKCMKHNPFNGANTILACECRNPEECQVTALFGTSGNPCTIPDIGTGTVALPPANCDYSTPGGDMQIIDGLPAGDTIEIDSFFDVFFDISVTQGGSLGGDVENYKATMHMPMTGTGSLGGFSRNITFTVQCQSHSAPRTPGNPIQSFDTDMFAMQGQINGDPDFDLLRITAGTGFNMPSPGHTTLTQLPGGTWAVDSFFDITYRIDFIGAPGGALAGRSGSTTATIRMQMGAHAPDCAGICPPNTTCERTAITQADGTINVCCNCVPIGPPVCEPNAAGNGCVPIQCPIAGDVCRPKCSRFDPLVNQYSIVDCDCVNPNECHLELIGGGASPCDVPDNGNGTADLPPAGCAYETPDGNMHITEGLPPGSTIEIDSFFDVFYDISVTPGGPLGGEVEQYQATMHMPMSGTGGMAGYTRDIAFNIQLQTAAAPRTPNDPIQAIDTEMLAMQGLLPQGDPDFDLLRITAGTTFNMPSPGHTTLTRSGPNWSVDSFFDVFYRIDFVGKPGGPLGGMSGSTTGTIRMAMGTGAPQCVNTCPPGENCVRTVTTNPDGSINVCCDCEGPPPQVCEPTPDLTGCNPVQCPIAGEECRPKCTRFNPDTNKYEVTECDCVQPNECHAELIGGGGQPCIEPDNGTGTADLPPVGCTYTTPTGDMHIVDGLPVGDTIEIDATKGNFTCPGGGGAVCSFQTFVGDCTDSGGSLGGEKTCSDATLTMPMQGTGGLSGFNRLISMPISFEMHTAPRTPGNPVQSFDTDMFRLFGQITGDPDFDLLRVVAGTDFGMPSPGHTTLTKSGPNWAVDSFFDITYRIDFVGKPGGSLSGMSGSTTATIRFAIGTGTPQCVDACPAGQACVRTQVVNGDGSIDVCCECQDLPQACCLPTGACVDTPAANCTSSGGTPQGAGTTCATLSPGCPQPPIITTWRSVRFHGPGAPNGELSIVLHPTRSGNGSTGPTVETRGNASTGVGIRKIEVDFDQPVVLVNPAAVTVTGRTTVGGVMQPPVGYLPASVVMVDADTMAITFGINALPNATCYNFNVLGSVQNGATQPLVGDTDCNVRSLQGDTTMNGEVTVSDQLATKAQVTAGATATAVPHFDVNLSGGTITITDQLLVKSQVGKKALCP